MKINIPKIITQISMTAYSSELEGNWLYVWVNPPMEMLAEYNQLVTRVQEQELAGARKVLVDGESAPENGRKSATGLALAFDQAAKWLNLKKETPADGLDIKLLDWYARLWSQGPAETHWTVSELRTLEAQDPAFLSWMIGETWQALTAHKQQKKKV